MADTTQKLPEKSASKPASTGVADAWTGKKICHLRPIPYAFPQEVVPGKVVMKAENAAVSCMGKQCAMWDAETPGGGCLDVEFRKRVILLEGLLRVGGGA